MGASLNGVEIFNLNIVQQVLGVTATIDGLERQTSGQGLREGTCDIAVGLLHVVIAEGHGHAARLAEAWGIADDVDRAAGNVLTQKYAMGPADHFDTLDVVEG